MLGLGRLTSTSLLAVGAALAVLAVAPAATAAPQSLSVQPRGAPVGTPLTISGAGCAGDVAIHVAAFLLPRGAFVVADLVATPDPSGDWTAQLPMPGAPAYVEATCDGVTAIPVVVTPAGVSNGAVAPAAVTAEGVAIELTGLVDGSEMLVLSGTGATLAAATAAHGSARVTLPRSLGPATVFATGLRLPALGVPLPYVPSSNAVDLPFAESPSVVASPRVSPGGTAVSARIAGCPGEMTVRVTGQASGFQDTPQLYTTRHALLAAPGRFAFSFPLPPEPATIAVTCTQGTFVEHAATITAPSSWTEPKAVILRDGADWVLTVQTHGALGPPAAAFTLAGVPVQLSPSGASPEGEKFRIAGTVRGPVLLLAEEQFPGEDASAKQDSRPQAWFADLGPADAAIPPTDATTPPPDAGMPPNNPEGIPVLADTGASAVLPAAAAGAAAVLFGCILMSTALRSHSSRRKTATPSSRSPGP